MGYARNAKHVVSTTIAFEIDESKKVEEFDYIVVGAGAAGCVVASRLGEDTHSKILLLEEGPDDNSIFVRANGGFFKTHGTERTFLFNTESEPDARGRRFPLLQGRTLGGGTSVNAMCYIRGQARDYNDWEAAGCIGWSYAKVLPYFRKAENNSYLAAPYHGTNGPMRVSDLMYRHILSEAFVRAAQEAGQSGCCGPVRYNHDFNGERQDGVGFYQIMSYRGERSSTSRSFLAQALKRNNISVQCESMVGRVLFDRGRAVGVSVIRKDRSERSYRATREVILCAGAFMSPKILLLSGIGPGPELMRHGIPVVFDSPNVGRKYQDHFAVPVDVVLNEPISLMGQDQGLKALLNGLQWLLFRSGPLSSNVVEAGGFFDIDGDGRPEIQLNALAISSAAWGQPVPREHRFSLAPLCLTCHSLGTVTLRSADPQELPVVRGNFLDERDVQNLVNGITLSRHIIAAPSLARYVAREALPGPGVGQSRIELIDYVRSAANTALHPTSTCAMGPSQESVVDPNLRVRGVEGLRVVDASVMPKIVRGNTAAPIIMIAERAGDLIRGRATAGGQSVQTEKYSV